LVDEVGARKDEMKKMKAINGIRLKTQWAFKMIFKMHDHFVRRK
jgi:hypothetical protein